MVRSLVQVLGSLADRSARIIEVGADGRVARVLLEAGWRQYLGLTACAPETARREMAAHDSGAEFYPYSELPGDPYLVRKNNADILILSGDAPRHLWRYHLYRHARHVVWFPTLSRSSLLGLAGVCKALARGRVRIRAVCAARLASGRAAPAVVLSVTSPTLPRKRFISPAIDRVCRRLREEQVDYLILRWFERLPAHEPRKDVDILIADDDVEAFDRVIAELPGVVECEIYSVSGLPGTDYRGTPHYPPALARGMLRRAVWWNDIFRVPAPEDHFNGLAYHAVYHKGEESGLESAAPGLHPRRPPSHDYAAVLRAMADSLSLDVEVSLEGLDHYLNARGMRPGLDTLARMVDTNRWVRRFVEAWHARHGDGVRGLCNFYIREQAVAGGYASEIVGSLRDEGFTVIQEIVLSPEEQQQVGRMVRGGNWGRGPHAKSGGIPAILVVCYDPDPIEPSAAARRRHPMLENERAYIAKKRIRERLISRLRSADRCNMLHSSDNGVEAMECLKAVLPGRVDAILRTVAAAGAATPAAAVQNAGVRRPPHAVRTP